MEEKQSKQRPITPEMKDRLLQYLCDEVPVGSVGPASGIGPEELRALKLEQHEVRAMIETFDEEGLVEKHNLQHLTARVRERAHAFLQKGGYTSA